MIAAKPTPLTLICCRLMKYSILIERVPYEEPHHLELHWTIESDETSSRFELYDNATILSKFAKALKNFPNHSEDEFIYQIGSEKPEVNFAYFFRLHFFLKNHRGYDATIDVRFVNNQQYADTRIVDYRLYSTTPRLRKLAKLFEEFSKLKSRILYWDDSNAFVGSVEDYRAGEWRTEDA